MIPITSLIGRDAELAILESLINEAPVNGGALVLFGEPGSGKSALLDVVGESAKAAGFRCIRVTGVEFEAAISYAALNQCLLPLQHDFRLLSEPHRGALTVALGLDEGPPPDVLLVSNAALSLLQMAARVKPICLIIDDLQWVDPLSAGVFGFVARRLSGSKIAFLASARTTADSFFDSKGLPYRVVGSMNDGDAAGVGGG